MAVMWKGKLKAGSTCDIPVTTLDLLPAFINASGDQAAKYSRLQGQDLIKLANTPKKSAPDRALYWYIGIDQGAMRLGDWKMTFVPGSPPELYHLGKDISEKNNLYNDQPEVAKKLTGMFYKWKNALPAPAWVPTSEGNDVD
jgi:arylsulfatase A-like enzyme